MTNAKAIESDNCLHIVDYLSCLDKKQTRSSFISLILGTHMATASKSKVFCGPLSR